MRVYFKLFAIILLFTIYSCGKKSNLDRYPESDFPREYPAQK